METDRPGPIATPSNDAPVGVCARIRRHLEQGAPWDACDVFREDRRLSRKTRTCSTWALSLMRAPEQALGRVRCSIEAHALGGEAADRLADILSLRGRLAKDEIHRAPDAAGARALAERARQDYLAAYALGGDPYPGINAATLSLLPETALRREALAQEIVAMLAKRQRRHLLGSCDAGRGAPGARRVRSGDTKLCFRLRADPGGRRQRCDHAPTAPPARASRFRKRPTHCGNCQPRMSWPSPDT